MKHELNHETCIAFISDAKFLIIPPAAFDVLSSRAVFVYLTFTRLDSRCIPSNKIMAKLSKMKDTSYKAAKKELVAHGFLYIQRHSSHGADMTYYFGAALVERAKENSDFTICPISKNHSINKRM